MLTRFVLLYAAMYAAYGVASPFLPAFVASRGIAPEQLGLVLGAGTAVRLVSAPLAGRLGDLFSALRTVLVLCIALAAFTTLGYLPAHGFWWFLAISMMQAAALAPMTVPELPHAPRAAASGHRIGELVRLPVYRNLAIVAALVLGSHAMHDAFAMIRWRGAGVSAGMGSVLWSEAVLAEVLVF